MKIYDLAAAAAGMALLAGALTSPVVAQDAARAPAPSSSPTGLLVFVAYRGNVAVPIHPTEVRLETSRQLAAAFAARGMPVVTYPDLEPLMRRWRVRSERDLSLDFLHALAEDFGLERLAVVKLVTYDDRILLLGRGLSTGQGWLDWADVSEAEGGSDLWSDAAEAAAELAALVETAGDALLDTPVAPASDDVLRPLVALPLRPAGVGRGDSELASQCLLRSLLLVGRWSVPDPSLVVNEMQHGGFDPYHLSAAARRRLASAFSATELLVPRMTAFPTAGTVSPAFLAGGEDMPERSAQLDRRVPVLFTVTLVASDSGKLVNGCAEYLPPEKAQGLFGRSTHTHMMQRYRTGTGLLVRSLLALGGNG